MHSTRCSHRVQEDDAVETWKRIEVSIQAMPVDSFVSGFQSIVTLMNDFYRYFRYIHNYKQHITNISSLAFMFYWQNFLHASLRFIIQGESLYTDQFKSCDIFLLITQDFAEAYTPYFHTDQIWVHRYSQHYIHDILSVIGQFAAILFHDAAVLSISTQKQVNTHNY